MKISNKNIYDYALILKQKYSDCNIKMPVKIGFFLQKNISTITELAKEVEIAKMKIGSEYGSPNEDNTGFQIPIENLEKANKELQDLIDIEQEVNLHMFKLDDFENIELTYDQLEAIMFMIEE